MMSDKTCKIETTKDMQDKCQKPTVDITQLPPRQAAMALLVENGVSVLDAGKAVGYKGNTPYNIKTKINKLSLIHPKMVKSAARVIRDVLDLKPIEVERTTVTKSGQVVDYTDNIYPSHTNAIQAAAMVYDRVEPVVRQQVNLNLNADIAPVDLEAYRR